MYLGVPSQPSCAMAWLAATQLVDAAPGHEAHNVIVDVEDPTREGALDKKVVLEVDSFLRTHELWPVQTVANTIFPQATYELHGSPAFYDVYLTKVFRGSNGLMEIALKRQCSRITHACFLMPPRKSIDGRKSCSKTYLSVENILYP